MEPRTSGREFWGLVVGEEKDGILDLLIEVLEFRALIPSVEGHLFDGGALVRVLN